MKTPKFAICQELFDGWEWARQCEFIAETGYQGIEVAPFTLADDLTTFDQSRRREAKSIAQANGLEVIGLHWLLAKTEGFHLTTGDLEVRSRTAGYFDFLTDLCADVGGSVMVLGSPLQRNLQDGISIEQAFDNAVEILRSCCKKLADRGVTICFEPLSTVETDFITTAKQGSELIAAIDHPNIKLHLDVKAMLNETDSIPSIISEFAKETSHFHANDGNLRGPGMGDVDFVPIFQALKDSVYQQWISVEVFDYEPGAEFTAVESLRYMQETWKNLV